MTAPKIPFRDTWPDTEELRRDAELGKAWRRCEAALPEGWALDLAATPTRGLGAVASAYDCLKAGDILICERMHWAWADEKVAVIRRESDGYEPGCSQYRGAVRHISGPGS